MNQNKILPLGIIAVGVVAAAVTGYQSRNLGTSSSCNKLHTYRANHALG